MRRRVQRRGEVFFTLSLLRGEKETIPIHKLVSMTAKAVMLSTVTSDGRRITIVIHGKQEISVPILRQIIKDLGLTKEEFARLIRKK